MTERVGKIPRRDAADFVRRSKEMVYAATRHIRFASRRRRQKSRRL
jgi:hypothetical protein